MYDTDDDLVELLMIPKVGRAKARALFASGYKSLRDIAKADPEALSQVPGIGPELARNIVWYASDIDSTPSPVDKLETVNELLICPLCGSMVSAGSSVCNGCGITFSDDVDDLSDDGLAGQNPNQPGPNNPEDKDGFWYKDQGKLFICPECGSLVSDGSGSCPKCGVQFDEEEELAPETVETVKPGDADGYWYKEGSTIFMCPNCGSFIKKDADGCASCGIVFEAGEEEPEPESPVCPTCKSDVLPDAKVCTQCGFDFTIEKETDGFWYKKEESLFMCPGCGAFITESATKCANCGAILEKEEENASQPVPDVVTCPMCKGTLAPGARDCPNCGFDFTTEEDKDGFWYKDSVSLFICPGCGAFLAEASDRCLNCGIVFEEDASVNGKTDTAVSAEKIDSDRALEVSKEMELEKQVDDLIDLVEIEDELETITAKAMKEEADELETFLVLDDEVQPYSEKDAVDEMTTDAPDPSSLYLCPICGAFIQSSMTKCPSCKTVFDDIEEMVLEPVGSVTVVQRPEDLAKEMALEIEEIEAELLEPPKPKKEEKKGGVSKDFLDRWKKLDNKVPGVSKPAKEPEARKLTNLEIEEELGLEDIIAPIEDVKLEAEVDELANIHSDDEFWTEMARDLTTRGKVEEAVACFDRAAELNPDRELEYKRLMLELMGTGPMQTDVDLSEIAAIDEIGDLSIDEALVSENIQHRISDIEKELKIDRENGALWQEKGELLEKLGRHEEAVACFDRSIKLSYADLRKDSRDLTSRQVMPQIGVGLTNGQGRINGRVNGLLIQRGLGIDETGDITNGKGRVNGLVNGRGRINGMINGLAKGRVNGKVNGLTNGRTNGRGRINGRTNGRVNGQIGRINGTGMINGRSNGLINGGLVNGLGLVNGEGMIDGSGSLRRLRHRRRERVIWRYRLSAMVLFVTIVLMMSMLSNLMVEDREGRITIDGNFADWGDVEGYSNFLQDAPIAPGLKILETRISQDVDGLDMFIQFEGDAFTGGAGTVDSVWAFVDINPALNMGYIMQNMGIDLMVEIYGWNHTVMGSNLLRFDNTADRNDWNGLSNIGSVSSACYGPRLETTLRIPRDMTALVQEPRVLVMTLDSEGNSDVTRYFMSPDQGGMAATFTQSGTDILAPATGSINFGEVVLSVHSSEGAAFRGLDFEITGDGNASDILNPSLRLANQVVPATVSFAGDGFSMRFSGPLDMALNSSAILTLEAEIAPSASGKTLGISLAGANVSSGLVNVQNRNSRLHNIGLPSGLSIDGAFGDWAQFQGNPDPADDVLSQKQNASFINSNIDLAETRFMMDETNSLFFYLSVQGIVMGGADLPTIRYRPEPATPINFTDSDRDSVPDNFDTYYQDFNNDGIPDSQAITNGNLADMDGDGVADYPNGSDWWLNATIPQVFPSPYDGKVVSIYIGPVSTEHIKNLGDDRAYVLIDADDDAATGGNLRGGFGIEFIIEVSGKNNRIIASELYRHDLSSQPTGWSFVRNVSAALDWNRMEGAIGLSIMGIMAGQNFTVFISTEDWKGGSDEMTRSMNSELLNVNMISTGTRAPKPKVDITKTAPATAAPGDTITYTIRLTNTGQNTAYGIVLTETYPAGVTFVSASPSPTSGNNVWSLGTLPVRGTITITITMRINPAVIPGTVLTNTASVFYTDGAGWTQTRTATASTIVIVPIPEMQTLVIPVFGIVVITFILLKKRRYDHGKDI